MENGQWLASSPERKWLQVEADVRGGGMIAWQTRKNVCAGGSTSKRILKIIDKHPCPFYMGVAPSRPLGLAFLDHVY